MRRIFFLIFVSFFAQTVLASAEGEYKCGLCKRTFSKKINENRYEYVIKPGTCEHCGRILCRYCGFYRNDDGVTIQAHLCPYADFHKPKKVESIKKEESQVCIKAHSKSSRKRNRAVEVESIRKRKEIKKEAEDSHQIHPMPSNTPSSLTDDEDTDLYLSSEVECFDLRTFQEMNSEPIEIDLSTDEEDAGVNPQREYHDINPEVPEIYVDFEDEKTTFDQRNDLNSGFLDNWYPLNKISLDDVVNF